MKRAIVIESYPWEVRAAVIEDGKLVELHHENQSDRVGNVYRGRVKDVLPGLSCAFVDIGYEKTSFLYVGDIKGAGPGVSIAEVVKKGQNLMVQVKKEEVTGKGARITTNVAIPGHYLVLLPYQKDVSISRKIQDARLRDELREYLKGIKPDHVGLIVRTAGAYVSWPALKEEMEALIDIWQGIKDEGDNPGPPALLYKDPDITQRILRDYVDADTERITVNDEPTAAYVREYLANEPMHRRTELVVMEAPFEAFSLDGEIERLLRERVWLKSGGFLVIEETEAMTVVDVNSGKYTGKSGFAETVLRINLEAAREIPRQLRLRGIGGIVLIDFIDMKEKQHRDEVLHALADELAYDKAHTRVLGITKLGMVEMTRKKSRASLGTILKEDCACCHGRGRIPSMESTVNEILRRLAQCGHREKETVEIEIQPRLLQAVTREKAHLEYIKSLLKKEIVFTACPAMEEDFRILP